MTDIASAAMSVLIGYLAANTTTLHLGSGGIMLPNHAPLVIAEQFGSLTSLYPGRIDLGLGRAPSDEQRTMTALRRHLSSIQRHRRASATTFAAADARVIVNYRQDEVGAADVVSDIRMLSSDSVAVQADVSRETDVEHLFDTAQALQARPIL